MTLHTPITDLLDAHRVSYRRMPHAEPVFTIEAAAAQRGVVRDEMVKAILLREAGGQRRFVMACCLGDDRVDPKAVRTHLAEDWRRLTFASDDEIRQVTTGIKGAVAPLALPASIPVVLDQAIAYCTNVNISSGGQRGDLGPVCGQCVGLWRRDLDMCRQCRQPKVTGPVQLVRGESVDHRWQAQTVTVEISDMNPFARRSDAADAACPVVGGHERGVRDFYARCATECSEQRGDGSAHILERHCAGSVAGRSPPTRGHVVPEVADGLLGLHQVENVQHGSTRRSRRRGLAAPVACPARR